MKSIHLPYYEAKQLLDTYQSVFFSLPISDIKKDIVFKYNNQISDFHFDDSSEPQYMKDDHSLRFWCYMGDATHYSETIYPPFELKTQDKIKIDCYTNSTLFNELIVEVISIKPIREINSFQWVWLIELQQSS